MEFMFRELIGTRRSESRCLIGLLLLSMLLVGCGRIDDQNVVDASAVETVETVVESVSAFSGEEMIIDSEESSIPVLTAHYNGACEKGDALDLSKIVCEAVFEDGRVGEARVLSVELPGAIMQDTDVIVHTEYGDTILSVHRSSVLRISAEYTGKLHKGDIPDRGELQVMAYDDLGESRVLMEFDVSDFDEPVTSARMVTVSALGFSAALQLVPIEVASIHPNLKTVPIRGEMIDLSSITVIYADGIVKDIEVEDITFLTNKSKKLRVGENTYEISLFGETYSFTVTAQTTTNVEDAKKGFEEEFANADWSYASDSIFVTVTHYETELSTYDLAHIVINDAGQLRSELSNGSLGGEREFVTDAAERLDWVIGTNASNFDYATGKPTYASCIIKNRVVMEGTKTNGMEICLMSNGVLFSPVSGVDPYALVASDVTDSWSCGDTLLVEDGKAVNVGIQSEQYRYPRTAIGMVQPCEYYLLVSGEANYERGLTYDEVRNILLEHNCKFGKCMDGGGSATMVVNDGSGAKIINETVANPRAVSDFLYFGEGVG